MQMITKICSHTTSGFFSLSSKKKEQKIPKVLNIIFVFGHILGNKLHYISFYLLILICCTQVPLRGFLGSVPSDYHSYALITMVLLSTFLILMAKWASRRKPTMTRKRKKLLLDQQEFVTNVVKAKKVSA